MVQRITLLFALAACVVPSGQPTVVQAPPPATASEPTAASEPAAPASPCADLAAAWDIDGGCGNDRCTITQNGCAITQVSCRSGAHSTTGTIEGDTFEYTGVSGVGIPATCRGTASGGAFTGTCTVAGQRCDFSGERD